MVPRVLQLGMTAAGDELLRLDEELDVADAAAPELDVVARHRDRAVALEGVHLALHRVDVGDGGEVEIFAARQRARAGAGTPRPPRRRRQPPAP